jgi:hypothetical protein
MNLVDGTLPQSSSSPAMIKYLLKSSPTSKGYERDLLRTKLSEFSQEREVVAQVISTAVTGKRLLAQH